MTARSRVLTDAETGRARRVRWAAATAAGALLVAAGLVAWRATDGGAAPSRAGTAAEPPASPAPTLRVVAGVREGYPNTAQGARQAAMAFVEVEAGDLMAEPDAYRAAWREMCTPDYWSSAGRDSAEAVLRQQEAVNHLITSAARGERIYERAAPLSATLVSGGTDTASVRTWSVLIQHPGDGPTTVAFAAGIVDLRWTEGAWKLDGGSGLTSLDEGTSGPLQLSPGPGLPGYLGDAGGSDAPAS